MKKLLRRYLSLVAGAMLRIPLRAAAAAAALYGMAAAAVRTGGLRARQSIAAASAAVLTAVKNARRFLAKQAASVRSEVRAHAAGTSARHRTAVALLVVVKAAFTGTAGKLREAVALLTQTRMGNPPKRARTETGTAFSPWSRMAVPAVRAVQKTVASLANLVRGTFSAQRRFRQKTVASLANLARGTFSAQRRSRQKSTVAIAPEVRGTAEAQAPGEERSGAAVETKARAAADAQCKAEQHTLIGIVTRVKGVFSLEIRTRIGSAAGILTRAAAKTDRQSASRQRSETSLVTKTAASGDGQKRARQKTKVHLLSNAEGAAVRNERDAVSREELHLIAGANAETDGAWGDDGRVHTLQELAGLIRMAAEAVRNAAAATLNLTGTSRMASGGERSRGKSCAGTGSLAAMTTGGTGQSVSEKLSLGSGAVVAPDGALLQRLRETAAAFGSGLRLTYEKLSEAVGEAVGLAGESLLTLLQGQGQRVRERLALASGLRFSEGSEPGAASERLLLAGSAKGAAAGTNAGMTVNTVFAERAALNVLQLSDWEYPVQTGDDLTVTQVVWAAKNGTALTIQ